MSETENGKVEAESPAAKESTEANSSHYIGQPPTFDYAAKEDFSFFQTRLNLFFEANDITSDVKKKAILLASLSNKSFKLLTSLCAPESPDNLEFEVLFNNLQDYFEEKEVKPYFTARLAFYIARKERQETYQHWAERLQGLANDCNFQFDTQKLVRDMFVVGLFNGFVKAKLLQEDPTNSDLTIEALLELAAKAEAIKDPADDNKKCTCCGLKNHEASICKHKGKVCNHCGKNNHVTPNCPEALKLKARRRKTAIQQRFGNNPRYMNNRGNPGNYNNRMNYNNSLFQPGGNKHFYY